MQTIRNNGLDRGREIGKLDHTGERVVEELYKDTQEDYLIYLAHVVSYKFSMPYVRDKRVLDFGCGSGYGTALIASEALTAVGVDISRYAIDYARDRYRRDNLEFRHIRKVEDENLPFSDGEFDVVISLQVIEHLSDTETYFSEIRRVLKHGGVFILATPDRDYRLFPFQKPWNRYHVREYSSGPLLGCLRSWFSSVESFKMTGDMTVLRSELRRARILKWITLPFTFPGSPEWWRIGGLSIMKFAKRSARKFLGKRGRDGMYGINERHFIIEKAVSPSINIITVAVK